MRNNDQIAELHAVTAEASLAVDGLLAEMVALRLALRRAEAERDAARADAKRLADALADIMNTTKEIT